MKYVKSDRDDYSDIKSCTCDSALCLKECLNERVCPCKKLHTDKCCIKDKEIL